MQETTEERERTARGEMIVENRGEKKRTAETLCL